MNLVMWDPFSRGLEEVSNRLNCIFGRFTARTAPCNEKLTMADWAPSVNISETDAAYLVNAEIPGVEEEDIEVIILDGMLTIQGERRLEKEENGKKSHRVERCYGSFIHSFQVPDDADEDKVSAVFRNGMLNVTLAKSEKAMPSM